MLENYHYEAAQPLHCPIVACDALADPHASRGDAEGWKLETTGRFSIQRFGGDRSYIHREKEALTALIGNPLSVRVGALARSTASLTGRPAATAIALVPRAGSWSSTSTLISENPSGAGLWARMPS